MTKTELATNIILAAVTVGLIVYDVFVAVNPVRGDTISEVIRMYSYKYPMIPFGFGVLIGHFFW